MPSYYENFTPWSTFFLPKFKNLVVDLKTYAIGEYHFHSTPYEIDNPAPWDIPSYTVKQRPDFKLISAKTTGYGWEYTWRVRATKYKRSDFQANMGLQVTSKEFIDNQSGTDRRELIASGFFKGFIKDDGGIDSKRGDDGEDSLFIVAATPDFWMAKLPIAKLPYLNRILVEQERAAWASQERSTSELGYLPIGDGPFTSDPFAGFARYRDQYTMTPGELMTPVAANEAHIISPLSVSHALRELVCNHVFCNGLPLPLVFPVSMIVGQDAETNLIHVEYGPGSVQDAILEATRHGNWRYWWDAQCIMHFLLDYACYNYNTNLSFVSLVIADGSSLAGQIHVNLGPKKLRVNRVAVQGQWSQGVIGSESTPLEQHFDSAIGAIYPVGRQPGGEGVDVEFRGYQGVNCARMARTTYSHQSRRTTATISNFPYVSLAMALYNRVIGIACKDPMGSWDFRPGATSDYYIDIGFDGSTKMTTYSAHGKLFSVDDVSIEIIDPDAPGGGVPVATLTCTEIIPSDAFSPG